MTTTIQLERAANAMFPSEGNRVGNVKFFRGHNRNATAEQIAEQFNRADAQIRAGESHPLADIDGDLTR
jgi:hypothetical protein